MEIPSSNPPAHSALKINVWKFWATYLVTIVVAIFIVVIICQTGEQLLVNRSHSVNSISDEPQDLTTAKPQGHAVHLVAQLMFAMATVLLVGRCLGQVCQWLNQPAVIGEVLAGIALGPSLLGAIFPPATATLFPDTVMPALGVIAQFGVILYMLNVGLEFDISALRSKGHQSLAISHGSIILPMILGCMAAMGLYPSLAGEAASFTPFVLFVGVSLSITAFPVLARILADRGMSQTPLGVMALTCAAADDVTAWCLLAIVIGIVQSTAADAIWVVSCAVIFCLVMLLAFKPMLTRMTTPSTLVEPQNSAASATVESRTSSQVIFLLAMGLISAGITDMIGIHALFGAFLFGAMISHQSAAGKGLASLLNSFAPVMLPAFFAITGLRTQIGLLSSFADIFICLTLIALAILGKFGGSYLAARWTNVSHFDALRIGSLMNTRGLMELIVLNLGLDLGVLSPKLFTMLVIMAIVTTMMTGPWLAWIDRKEKSSPPSLN
jgi:Kef-type K+ transport system membrane component KefB